MRCRHCVHDTTRHTPQVGCADPGCGCTWTPPPRRKQIYKVTYPNGKIYVGMDLTGDTLYLGSPSAAEQIARDLGIERLPRNHPCPGVRKEILWESVTATDSEVRALEMQFIRDTAANNPAVGYNKVPRYVG